MKPKITIITVSYNVVEEIESTIQSVINQSYDNIEYIIIDGGSKDGTVDIIKKYDDELTYWVSEPDGGIYYGMNKGIQKSNGDWLCFMNAGDRFADNDVLKCIFKSDLIFENTDVIFGDVILEYNPYGRVLKRHNELYGEQQSLGICHQSSFTKGEILRKTLYDTSFRIFADINTFHEIWKQGGHFQYVPIIIAVFEGFNGVSSTKPWLSFKESNRISNLEWYTSFNWWYRAIKIMIKTFFGMLLSKEQSRKMKFKRISSKYIKL